MQLTIALHVGYPNNRIVSPVSRRRPRRPSPALTHVPGESNGWRTCLINYIRAKFAALTGMKSKVRSFTSSISGRRRTSKCGIGNVHRSNRRTDTAEIVAVKQIGVPIFAQREHQLGRVCARHVDDCGTASAKVGVAVVQRLPIGRRPKIVKHRPGCEANDCFAATPWIPLICESVTGYHKHLSAIAGDTAMSPDPAAFCIRRPSHHGTVVDIHSHNPAVIRATVPNPS